MTVSFDKTIIHLLPPPYDTQCHDYRQDFIKDSEGDQQPQHSNNYQCHADCMARCKCQQYFEYDGGWPGDVYATANIQQKFSKAWINDIVGSVNDDGSLIEGILNYQEISCSADSHCGQRVDCYSEQYKSRTVRVQTRDENNLALLDLFELVILPPKIGSRTTIIEHVPDYNLIDFVVNRTEQNYSCQ